MALVPSTSVGSGGAGGGGAMTQLFDSTLGASAASFDIPGIAGTFTSLRAILTGRGDTAANAAVVGLRFNGDAGASYNWQNLTGGNVTVAAAPAQSQSFMRIGEISAATAVANKNSIIVVDIHNYSGAVFQKCCVAVNTLSILDNAAALGMELSGGVWGNTVAVTQLTFVLSAGNFIAGSRCTVHGIT